MARLSLVMSAVFFLSAVVQFNDPDPLPWIAMYVATGVASGLGACALRGLHGWLSYARYLTGAVGVTAVVGAVLRARSAIPHLQPSHLFDSMKASTPAIEESRELFGLLLIAVWCLVQFLALRRAASRS